MSPGAAACRCYRFFVLATVRRFAADAFPACLGAVSLTVSVLVTDLLAPRAVKETFRL
jgi:hypothetical protein